jgi:recombination protein RecR
MLNFPQTIQNLIEEFTKLSGVGRKTAERYVFYLLKQHKDQLESFAQSLTQLQNSIFLCPECANFSESSGLCPICTSTNRDKATICIVEESHDLNVIESTNEYNGLYHVLGGTLNPIDGITEEKLNVKKLVERIANNGIQEAIIALNPDMPGEATTIFLRKLLQPYKIKITRLARGLPMGSDLEYADEVTVSNALKGRKEI